MILLDKFMNYVFVFRPNIGELQNPSGFKMNATTGGITKKRKKSDAKPQSQM